MQISLKKIREKGACASGQRWFKNRFGTRSVPVTRVLKALLKRREEFDMLKNGYSKWLIEAFYTIPIYNNFQRLWGWSRKEDRKAAIKWAIENVK